MPCRSSITHSGGKASTFRTKKVHPRIILTTFRFPVQDLGNEKSNHFLFLFFILHVFAPILDCDPFRECAFIIFFPLLFSNRASLNFPEIKGAKNDEDPGDGKKF